MGVIGDTVRIRGRGVRRALAVLTVLVLAAGVGSAVALSAPALVERLGLSGIAPGPDAPEIRVPVPTIAGLAAGIPAPTPAGVDAVLSPLAEAMPGRFTGTVLDPATGAVLWDRDSGTALVPGSTTKILTAAASLLTLSSTSGFATRVVTGPDPATVVLIGGGDPTLTALPEGEESVYQDPTRLQDLADAVREQVPGVQRVLVDLGRFTGDRLNPTWDPSDVGSGFVTPIEPLMLDGGRVDPAEPDGVRVDDPAAVAGAAFADALGLDPGAVSTGSAAQDARQIAQVVSAPFADLVEEMLRTSDNVLAESLAHEVALARGVQPTFENSVTETLAALSQAGFDTTGTTLRDGSGLSPQNGIPARLLAAVLGAAATPPEGPRDTEFLRPIVTGLPVAGGDGTLDDRFGPAGDAATGRGVVRAKTGSLTGVSSLAGVVVDADGRLLVFAVMSNGASPAVVRPRQDVIAATLGACGCGG